MNEYWVPVLFHHRILPSSFAVVQSSNESTMGARCLFCVLCEGLSRCVKVASVNFFFFVIGNGNLDNL